MIIPKLDICQKTNGNYFTYLKNYCKELVNEDARLTRIEDGKNLFIQAAAKYVIGKNMDEQIQKIRKLEKSEKSKQESEHTNLDTIYITINKILNERGWK